MLERKPAKSDICQNTLPHSCPKLTGVIIQDDLGAGHDVLLLQLQPGQHGSNRSWEQKQNQKHQESPAGSTWAPSQSHRSRMTSVQSHIKNIGASTKNQNSF